MDMLAHSGHPTSMYKLVVVGDMHVGKTSLVSRFVSGHFSRSYAYTSGGDVLRKDLNINGETVSLKIVDTMGQRDFKSVIKSLYRHAHGVMVVYDVTRQNSFQDVPKWMEHIKKHVIDEPRFVIVGNKTDLNDYRAVNIQEAELTAAKLEVPYFEVSALKNERVKEAFYGLIKHIWEWFGAGRPVHDLSSINIVEEVPDSSCCS